MTIIISNVIALIGSSFMVYSGVFKNKNKILLIQSIECILLAISNFILGGITGAIINLLGIVRNYLCTKNKLNISAKIVITVLAVGLSISFNNLGLLGYLPVISTISYIWLMTLKKVQHFKLLIIFTMILWVIYDLMIKSYTSAIFSALTIITNLLTLKDSK